MKSIWKFHLQAGVPNKVFIPMGARILDVQFQGGSTLAELCMWALLDPQNPGEERHFMVYGTGWKMPDNPGEFIGTVQQGMFVWHVFETKEQ